MFWGPKSKIIFRISKNVLIFAFSYSMRYVYFSFFVETGIKQNLQIKHWTDYICRKYVYDLNVEHLDIDKAIDKISKP